MPAGGGTQTLTKDMGASIVKTDSKVPVESADVSSDVWSGGAILVEENGMTIGRSMLPGKYFKSLALPTIGACSNS